MNLMEQRFRAIEKNITEHLWDKIKGDVRQIVIECIQQQEIASAADAAFRMSVRRETDIVKEEVKRSLTYQYDDYHDLIRVLSKRLDMLEGRLAAIPCEPPKPHDTFFTDAYWQPVKI